MEMGELAECYEKHSEALLRFAASVAGPTNAADVLSVAVLGVLQSAKPEISDLRAYLYRAVANAGAKHWRAADRRSRRERAFAALQRFEEPSGSGLEFSAAIAVLSPQQRAVIHLTYWEDLTPGSVADRLGVSDGTVRRQLARARNKLKESLNEHR